MEYFTIVIPILQYVFLKKEEYFTNYYMLYACLYRIQKEKALQVGEPDSYMLFFGRSRILFRRIFEGGLVASFGSLHDPVESSHR